MSVIEVGYAQVNHFFAGTGAPTGAQITYGIDHRETEAGISAVALELHDAFGDTILTDMTDDVQLTQTLVKYGPNISGPSYIASGVRAGGYNTNSTAPNTAYLVHKATGFGGRAGQGRFYVPGVAEANIDDGGQLITAAVTNINARLVTFLARIEDFDLHMVLLHQDGSIFNSPTGVEGLSVDSRAATQRRRLRR